ncbi:CPBP family glutamic-type intramembrane protease [Pedobacter sp. WC2501]|uniref:CPBP family glutamic-type intramembrane protease n=1 Tax=Pedobacter sp. WC2501 TaxID=3461400 RepID=UPI0040467E79
MAPEKEISFNIFCVFYLGPDIKLLFKEHFSYMACLYLFSFAALIVHGYFKRIDIRKRLIFQRRSFGYLFYYAAIIFGLTHLGNIKGLTLSDPAFPLFVSSQIFTGLSLGFIRIKYGLGYSMLLHGCFNFILVLLTFFFS